MHSDDPDESEFVFLLTNIGHPEIRVTQGGNVALSGTGMYAFAPVRIGEAIDAVFTIENIGKVDLELTGPSPAVSLRLGDSDFTVQSQPGPVVAAGESTTFTVRFRPLVRGLRKAELNIASNDEDENPYAIPLAGMAFAPILISGGWAHSLALTAAGAVWGWGGNYFGQVGDGTTTERFAPVALAGLSGMVAVAAGGEHSVALDEDGRVWSWGQSTGHTAPAEVSGLSGVVAIAAGARHSVALKSDSTVWGLDSTPGPLFGLTEVSAIAAAGGWHTLLLKADGTVWAWGRNDFGQLGDGTTVDRANPVQVDGLGEVTAIAAGHSHSAALKGDGTVWAWGQTGAGALNAPQQVAGIAGAAAIAAGQFSTLMLLRDGSVWQFDSANGTKQVDSLSDVVAIAAGYDHWIALRADGMLLSWGDNYHGQLGIGIGRYWETPVQVVGLSDITAVCAGDRHSLALSASGTVWSWGSNRYAQLGIGSQSLEGRNVPGRVEGTLVASGIAAGFWMSLALKSDGSVWAWGQTPFGTYTSPEQATAFSQITSVAAGIYGVRNTEIVALKNDGSVWFQSHGTMEQVAGLTEIIALDDFGGHTALRSDGTVWIWDYTNATLAPVAGIPSAISAAGGSGHFLVAASDGNVWAWGANYTGQLGDGTTIDRPTPGLVLGLSDIARVAAGGGFSLALQRDGTVWAWGSNFEGQLGDGTSEQRTLPVRVSGLSDITAISTCGGYGAHSLALRSDGTVWAWGNNVDGQLGNGISIRQDTPVEVVGLRL